MKNLANIKNILFDCDGVLYQDLEAVFGQVSKKMTEYISKKLNIDLKKAKELQTNYFHKYNTSLNGLMIHHDIPPREFLDYVHDIDLSFLEKDKTLRYELENIKKSAIFAKSKGLDVHAGHGLNYKNISEIAKIEEITEVNIGHFLIGEAIKIGITEAILKMRSIIDDSRKVDV